MSDLFPWTRRTELAKTGDGNGDPIATLHDRLDRIFEAWAGEHGWGPASWATSDFAPRIEVTDDESAIRVTVELPGMTKEDLDVQVRPEALVIKGEKKEEKKEEKKGYYRCERSYGSFARTVPFPCGVVADETKATMKDGVLEVVVPKSAEVKEKTRKVDVE